MTAGLLLLVSATLPDAGGYEVVIRQGDRTEQVYLAIDTDRGPLLDREAELLAGWKPSADGSDPLDRLVPEGRLLRVEIAPPSPHAEALTRALFAALDANHDGKLTPDELKDADKTLLARFDVDGDGCLTPLEIVPDLLTAEPSRKAARAEVAVEVMGRRFRREGTGDKVIALRLGSTRRVLHSGGFLLDLAADLPGPDATPATPKSLLKGGREKDRERFERIAREVVTLTVRPQPRGWFELLDADGDGQLSVRELRNAWSRLADTASDSSISPPSWDSSTVSITLTPGTTSRPVASLTPRLRPARGPGWFRSMDRNGDGDVSRAEFLGSDEEFHRIDTDGDGLISAEEAETFDRKESERRRP
jgi:Ca2+-binding EF-hand superfamily protein